MGEEATSTVPIAGAGGLRSILVFDTKASSGKIVAVRELTAEEEAQAALVEAQLG